MRVPIEHNVKILPEYYRLIVAGLKTFESRIDDRDYQAGDTLRLNEWNGSLFTGRSVKCLITDVYRGEYAKDNYCILSFQVVFPETEPRCPMERFMELHRLLLDTRRECEELRAKT